MRLGTYIDMVNAGGAKCDTPPGRRGPCKDEGGMADLNDKATRQRIDKAIDRGEDLDPGSLRTSKEVKKLAKLLKLPGGSGVSVGADYYRWEKRGGYADKALVAVTRAAKAAGFTLLDTKGHSSPDGNTVGGGEVYTKDDWSLTVRSSYGVTKGDNRFSVALRRTKK